MSCEFKGSEEGTCAWCNKPTILTHAPVIGPQYHKIHTVYKRDHDTGKLLLGQYSIPEFEYLKDAEWVFTEKVDGMNVRVMFDGENLTFGGKTDRAQMPPQLFTNLFNTFAMQTDFFRGHFSDGICLYGEGYGAKIQKGGGNYRDDQGFVLFDVKIGNWWLKQEDVRGIAKSFGIRVIPMVGCGTLNDLVRQVRNGIHSEWGAFAAEGIVARPSVELKARNGERIITKLKTRDFE